jgi:hypothetical protein
VWSEEKSRDPRQFKLPIRFARWQVVFALKCIGTLGISPKIANRIESSQQSKNETLAERENHSQTLSAKAGRFAADTDPINVPSLMGQDGH